MQAQGCGQGETRRKGRPACAMCQAPTGLRGEGMASELQDCPKEREEPGTFTQSSCLSLGEVPRDLPPPTLEMSLG